MFSWIEKIKLSPGKKGKSTVKNHTFPSENILNNDLCRRSMSLPSLNSFDDQMPVTSTKKLKKTFPLNFPKLPVREKDNSIIHENGVEVYSKINKKKFSCKSVFKKILSPKKNNKIDKLKFKKCKTTVEQLLTNRDSGWEDGSTCSSLSSLIIANEKFCTSSPIFQQKSPSRIQNDKLNNSVVLGKSPGVKTVLNFHEFEDSFNENIKKSPTKSLNNFSRDFGNFMYSKSDSTLFPLLDMEEEIAEFSKDNRLRHTYPGMSNTTRRESCQELLKCLVSKMSKTGAKAEVSTERKIIKDSSESNIEQPGITRKSFRETLMEISRRRRCYVSKSSPEIGECDESIDENSGPNYSNSILNLFTINSEEQFEGFDQSLNEDSLNGSYSCLEDDFTFNSTRNSFVITMYV